MRYFAQVLVVVLVTATLSVTAQQETQFSHNMFTNMAINPGYTGMSDAICVTTLNRQQWVGFSQTYELGGQEFTENGGPQTTLLAIDGKVDRINSGFGLTLVQDKLGYESNTNLKLNYAYIFNAFGGKMGVGAQVGFLNKTIDFSKLNPLDPSDPILIGGSDKLSDMAIDYGFGGYFILPGDKGFVGLSTSQLAQTDIQLGGVSATPQLRRHYYLTGGYTFNLLQFPTIDFKPSILLKSDFGSWQTDINLLAVHNNRIWGGVSYRAFDAAVLMFGMHPFTTGKFAPLKIGYAYDITTSQVGGGFSRSYGSHEIFLNYCFKITIDVPRSSYRNVRYFD